MKFIIAPLVVVVLLAGTADRIPHLMRGNAKTKAVDLSQIGMKVDLPSSWAPNGSMIKTTVGEFHRQVYEKVYTKPDSNRVIVGSIGYSAFSVDSTLLPDLAAYQAHEFKIEMYGYYGWYKRWLWSQGKRQFRESYEVFFLDRMSDLQGNPTYEWIEYEVLKNSDPRKAIKDAFAVEFKWRPKSTEIEMQAQLYYLTEGARCYRIQVGGTHLNFEENRDTYAEVMRSIGFIIVLLNCYSTLCISRKCLLVQCCKVMKMNLRVFFLRQRAPRTT